MSFIAPFQTGLPLRVQSSASVVCARLDGVSTRRQFLNVAVSCAAFLSLPTSAFAVGGLTEASATAVMRSARDKLGTLRDATEIGEYESARLTLRRAPLGQIRQAGTTLVDNDSKRKVAYRAVLAAVENLDTRLLRAERGGDTGLEPDIDRAITAMDDFLAVL